MWWRCQFRILPTQSQTDSQATPSPAPLPHLPTISLIFLLIFNRVLLLEVSWKFKFLFERSVVDNNSEVLKIPELLRRRKKTEIKKILIRRGSRRVAEDRREKRRLWRGSKKRIRWIARLDFCRLFRYRLAPGRRSDPSGGEWAIRTGRAEDGRGEKYENTKIRKIQK